MQRAPKQPNRNMLNLAIDLVIFAAFLIAMAPHFSGIAIHEWLSIAFGASVITHLLLHWDWIVGVTKRLFSKINWSARINYALNLLLFIDMTVVIFTGLMISEVALPLLGVPTVRGGAWRPLHNLSANLSLVLVGLHTALHWQWIVGMFKRLVGRVSSARRLPAAPELVASSRQLQKER